MRFTKMLGLLAVAAAAVMAFAATASATQITSPAGTLYTSTIKSEGEGKPSLHGENGVTIACNSNVEGKIETHGTSVTAEGKISKLTWSNCEGGTATTVTNGKLIAHATGSSNATLTSTGSKVKAEVSSIFGTITCEYETNATSIGTLTGSTTTGGNATLDISASIPRVAGSFLCGEAGTWTGSYRVTSPSTLNVD